ncbi:uncharacterized protein PRCAT00006099001 [Priceomyces carsonii]|uniref:uncharacterized protein n=1 Tax=Priceomyces carsonii TaxID=28549 RepID=UPI002EDA51BD|nr:unnamed protein product [Priceomyces carsonii]
MTSHSREASITSSFMTGSGAGNNHPEKIGPWKLGKTLGRGATGRVLLATHESNGQKAAVKVVSKSELQYEEEGNKKSKDDAGLPYGIEREIIIMKLLTHPNVLRLYDVWETSKALYLVLEYVEGGELFDLLVERGPLQEVEAIKYFRQIILGTAYCHALGICHRDLKPENLLLDASLNVKLADFGMAALESHGKLLETSCGSPHYAAPEIVSGLRYHGAASDVWSCGVILFALLTGRLPFDDENIRNLLLKVQAGSFEMPEELSYDAKDLISKMLTVDPLKRIPTEKIIKHPLMKKYLVSSEDLISIKSLPHPETASKSLGSTKNIDKQILSNLSILWHDRPQEDIIDCLLKNGTNPEKTFYALLMRYRHNHDDPLNPGRSSSFNNGRRSIARSGSTSNKDTPRRRKISQISASRRTSFQYKGGTRAAASRLSAASSFNNSPSRDYSFSPSKSPRRSPRRSPRKSPRRSPHKAKRISTNGYDQAVPRNIYNEIVSAQRNGDVVSPAVPSKDNLALKSLPQDLMASAKISPPKSKRASLINSVSKNRLSRRKSLRASMTTGLKRNSITMKLLSTYAKLSGESDWEYMDKQTRRTSATFATLCDKIFNQEEYDVEDEMLIDEEEKQAKEYERLMEIERKKHEAEVRARKELEKKKKRQNRRSLLSSRKLSILIKEDKTGTNNSESEIEVAEIDQPKRASALRSISEAPDARNDILTAQDVENIKRRSVTQPTSRRRNPILTRRPVSKLDPLWVAFENEEIDRAKDALDEEMRGYKGKSSEDINAALKDSKSHKKVESMLADSGERISRDSSYTHENYELPTPKVDKSDLSEEYMSEIRKSRLLNSKLNLKDLKDAKRNSRIVSQETRGDLRDEPHTLIGDVKIPNVTRKSRCFTNSNKRLSVLSMYSTKESYGDLNSILKDKRESGYYGDGAMGKANMPTMRTSFADRLDRAGLPVEQEEEDEPLDEGSIMDFDEHLANKRTSYYDSNRNSKYSSMLTKGKRQSQRPASQLPSLPTEENDETFVTKNDEVHQKRRSSNVKDKKGTADPDDDLFDHIKLPNENKSSRTSQARSSKGGMKPMLPSAESMLLPDLKSDSIDPKKLQNPKTRAQRKPSLALANLSHDTIPPTPPSHDGKKAALKDSTNKPDHPVENEKRNRSIFRKLSWGTKKTLDSKQGQLPSPADSITAASNEESKSGSFFRWFSSSHTSTNLQDEIKRYNTILPRQEMSTALYTLLSSWSNFGLKNLKHDTLSNNITGAISKHNAFNLKSCKFRIKINSRGFNQKSEIVCARVRGSQVTTDTLFKEIEKVLRKEGVLEGQ